MAIHRSLADAHGDADDEDQPGEDPDVGLEEDMRHPSGEQLLSRNRVAGRDHRLLPRSRPREYEDARSPDVLRNHLAGLHFIGVANLAPRSVDDEGSTANSKGSR